MNDLGQRVADSKRNVIESDRRARTARAVFMVTVVGALASLLVITAWTLDRVQTQVSQQQEVLASLKTLLEEQHASTDELKKNTAEQLDKQTRYIECIARFFASSDRTGRVIEDINRCVIKTTATSSDSSSGAAQVASQPQDEQPTVSPAQSGSQSVTSPQGDGQQQQPEPQPQPPLIQQLLNGIGGILKL